MILIMILLFAVTMGYFEASIVIYLRELYYPYGFSFPLQDIPDHILLVELCREFFSIVMIVAVAMAAGRKRPQKVAFFLLIFGVWDIVYYLILKLFLDWPHTLMDWDLLFLIPIPWVAPVLAPVLAAASFTLMGMMIYHLDLHGHIVTIVPRDYLAAAVTSTPILVSFFLNSNAVVNGHFPVSYSWGLFLGGLIPAWCYFLIRHRSWRRI